MVRIDLTDITITDTNPAATAASAVDQKAAPPTPTAASGAATPKSGAALSLTSFLSKHSHQLVIAHARESFHIAFATVNLKRQWLHVLSRAVTRARMVAGKPSAVAAAAAAP